MLRARWIGHLVGAHRIYNEAIDADIQYKDARYICARGHD